MKKLFCLSISSIALLGLWSAFSFVAGGKLEFDTVQQDGRASGGGASFQKTDAVEVGKATTYTIKFRNSGDDVLTMNCKNYCECISLTYPMTPIKKGESKSMTVKFSPKSEGNFEHKIDIETNEKPAVKHQIIIKGKAVKGETVPIKDVNSTTKKKKD